MTREEKIEAIYKEMANKEVSFGCRCRINDGEDVIFIRENKTWSYLSIRENEEFTVSLWYTPEIIWHPVMIWDVISYLRKPFNEFIESKPVGENWLVDRYFNDMNNLLVKWFDTSLPIDEQDDECVDYIYSLIPSISME